MVEVEVTWSKVTKIWWSILWRYILFAALIGGLFGFIVGVFATIVHMDKTTLGRTCLIGGLLTAFPVSLWVLMKVIRKKNFGDFRIALMTDRIVVDAVEDVSTTRQFYINK